MRNRLIELLMATNECEGEQCTEKGKDCQVCLTEKIADYLLANGVIVPPCKVGDVVYKVVRDKRVKKPYECEVVGFWYSKDENCNNAHLVRYVNGVFDSSFSVPLTEFGKTVFLTKEEAEAKL